MSTGRQPLTILLITAILYCPLDASSDEPTWSCYQETDSCYYFPDFLSSQLDASCLCRSLGGHLIKLDSLTELDFVQHLLRNESHSAGFWLGATSRKKDYLYLWEDGSNAGDMIPWFDDEPNHPRTEYCTALINPYWLHTPRDFFAFDVLCNEWGRYPLCEKGGKSVRVWSVQSSDEIYPSSRLESYSNVSSLECAYRCERKCQCFSIAHRQDGGDCILYKEYFRFLTSPVTAPGYVNFD